jgi:acyl-coenzyme A synthetase/AMP-(fatty) acid ligase
LADEVDRATTELGWHDEMLWVAGATRPWRGRAYEDVVAAESADEPDPSFVGGGFPTMIYTSGTTGRPKGIERTIDPATAHRTLLGIAGIWDLSPDDVHLVAGPLYHTGPASYGQVHLLIGGTVVVMPRFDAADALASDRTPPSDDLVHGADPFRPHRAARRA